MFTALDRQPRGAGGHGWSYPACAQVPGIVLHRKGAQRCLREQGGGKEGQKLSCLERLPSPQAPGAKPGPGPEGALSRMRVCAASQGDSSWKVTERDTSNPPGFPRRRQSKRPVPRMASAAACAPCGLRSSRALFLPHPVPSRSGGARNQAGTSGKQPRSSL